MSVMSLLRSVAAAALMCAAFHATAQVGLIQFTAGDVKIRNAAGEVRAAVKGGTVSEGDTLLTAAGASAQLKMTDGGILAVRPETELKVDTYRYAGKEDGTEHAVMSLVKGGFRTITGLIGRTNKQNYTINTPTAVIGIRGTDHEPIVIPAVAGPGKPQGPAGTYDKVNVGQAFIRTPLGEVNIRQNQVGFAGVNQAPALLPKVPEFFKATPPVRQAAGSGTQTGQGSQSSSSSSSESQGTQTLSASGSGSGSSSSSSGSAASGSGTSTATSEIRSNAVVDSTPTTASTGTTSTTTAVVPVTPTVAPAVTTSTATTAPATVVQPITGTSADNGALTLNLTNQTATSGGTTTPLAENTPVATPPSVAAATYASLLMSQAPVGNTTQSVEGVTTSPQPNTAYGLDSKQALLEIQHTGQIRSNTSGTVQTIADADLKLADGKAADIYASDGNTMYIGRQEGGSIRVTDNSGSASPFTQSLNASSAHWLIAVEPGRTALPGGVGAITSVQNIVGTGFFNLAGATHPTDLKGNVGTLTSAIVAADFSSQTVLALVGLKFDSSDAVNRSTRDFELSAAAFNVPIRLAGFDAVAGTSTAPIVSCMGTGCADRSYQGTIRGLFSAPSTGSGGIGSSLGLGYTFGPTGSGGAYDDLVQGTAVLSAHSESELQLPQPGSVIAFANNANVRHEVMYDTFQTGPLVRVNNAFARDTFTLTNPTTQTLSGVRSNTNYLFDLNDNLVRVFDTPYVIFDHGTNVGATSTGFTAPTPLAHAQVSLGGLLATPADLYTNDAIGIRMGRWQGGVVNVTDLETGQGYVEDLGDRSVAWLVRAAPTSLPVTGVYQYTKAAATSPTDAYGNAGTLDRASMEVDFSRSRVSASVGITMPTGMNGSLGSQSLSGYFTDVPLSGSGFVVNSSPTENPANTDNLHVNCRGSGCAASQTYGGRFQGGFSTGSAAGNTADGAYLRYTFVTNYADSDAAGAAGRVFDDYIDGFVAFKQGPEIAKPSFDIMGTVAPGNTTVKPAGDANIIYAYNYINNSILQVRSDSTYSEGGAGYEVDATGRLVSAKSFFDSDTAISGTNPAASPAPGTVHVSSGTNNFDIAYGYYVAPTLSGRESGTDFASRTADTLQWIRGPAIYPFYVSMATTNPPDNVLNTIGYAQLAGVVTNQTGAVGTLNSASLSVNFNAQTVNAAVDATVPGNNRFIATANGISLDGMGSFWAVKNGPVHHSFDTLTLNGSGSGVNGTLQGSLIGPGLEGAGFVFDFVGASARAMGSVVFGNPTYSNGTGTVAFSASPFTEYQLGMVASGMNGLALLTKVGGGPLSEENSYRVDIGAVSPGRTQFVDYQTANAQNPAGALVKFDAAYPFAYGCTGTVCSGATEMAARYAITDATGGGPLPANNPSIPAPTAKVLEAGFDPATGIRWGRWGGGTINVGDRASSNSAGGVPTADGNGTTNQVDLSVNNWHYLITGVQSGPVVLPVTGTYTYQLIGGTSPTSYTPGQSVPDVGTLIAAQTTLKANFTSKTVDVTVGLTTPMTGTWSAAASNVPILKDTGFSAERALNGVGNLAVTRNDSSTNTAGKIVGGFAGPTGQGAGIAYSLNQGGANGTTVSGVAAFKRP